MVVDSRTLRDLKIVPTPGSRGTTLWTLIDRTQSRTGNRALRDWVLTPKRSAEDILSLQEAHQALNADSAWYRLALDGAAADAVEHYLESTWQLPDTMPPAIRMRKWYSEYARDVELGRLAVRSLFRWTEELRDRLARTGATSLQQLSATITAQLETAPLRELQQLAAGATAGPYLRFDQLTRDTAKPVLRQLLTLVGRVEAMWSVGVATAEHGWTYPRPGTCVDAIGLVHPFLGSAAVPNDLRLPPSVRVCFLTGPNMAGKSTFLKALGLAILLAHAGSGVPASAMEFVPVGALFSSVEIADDLAGGESFYLAEVRRIAALAYTLEEHGSALAVIDEPFRGTNVHDAAEATLAIVTRLAAQPSALTIVASHVAEVVPAILDDERIALFNFSAIVTDDQPSFDYRLRPGVSDQRLGMTLLRREGVLDALDRSARSTRTAASVR